MTFPLDISRALSPLSPPDLLIYLTVDLRRDSVLLYFRVMFSRCAVKAGECMCGMWRGSAALETLNEADRAGASRNLNSVYTKTPEHEVYVNLGTHRYWFCFYEFRWYWLIPKRAPWSVLFSSVYAGKLFFVWFFWLMMSSSSRPKRLGAR